MDAGKSSRVGELGLLLASSSDGAIGDGQGLLWHLPEDLARFKALTMGHSCLLGRVTLYSIGRSLPGRQMVVLSRKQSGENAPVHAPESNPYKECLWAGDLESALALCSRPKPIWVVGGAEIYRLLEDRADFVERTEVEGLWPEARARFELNAERWTLVREDPWQTSRSGLRYRYLRYERRN
jgi:dihydrofolate reductase